MYYYAAYWIDKDDEPIEKDDEPESGASATEFPQQIDSSERGLLRWLWINLCELNLIPSSLCRSRIPILVYTLYIYIILPFAIGLKFCLERGNYIQL